MTKPDVMVSIVLTTYKRSKLLPDSVYSVLNGTYTNFEIIIVDDFSNDDTEYVANRLIEANKPFRISYLKQEVNKGVLAARNRGFDEAAGELVAILDDDDTLVPSALETIVASYNKLPENERGILWFDCLDKEANKKSGISLIPGGRLSFEDYLCGKVKGDFWLVFAKDVLNGKRFDERLRAHESLFWLQLHKEFPAVYIPIVVCEKAREHGVRLCDLESRMKYLPQTVLAYSEYLIKFGEDFKRVCPKEYGFRIAFLGFHQLMVGDKKNGRTNILTSLRYRFSIKYLAVLLLSFLFGKNTFKKIFFYSEVRS